MKTVSIAKLKDHLSSFLDEVERGEEIVVRNRKRPVAIIIRFPGDEDKEEQRLVTDGKLRVPTLEMNRDFWNRFWDASGVKIAPRKLARAVVEDRDEER